MITLTRKQQIIMRHLAGESNRQGVASALHISKDTVNKYVKEYDAQRAELLAKDPCTDPNEVLQAFVEQPKFKVTPEMRAAVAECLRLNEEKRASGRRKQEMRKNRHP